MIYVMAHEYSDKSGLAVCGATEDSSVAVAWYRANDENNVYVLNPKVNVTHWMEGVKGWRQEERERNQKSG